MNEQLFRQKSLDKVKSPESLDDYIQVSNPSIWLLLISIILLLAGACVWGVLGQIDSTVNANVRIQNGSARCSIDDEISYSLKTGMVVKFDGYEASILEIEQEEHGYVCTLDLQDQIPDGFYEGKIVVSSTKPISFIIN